MGDGVKFIFKTLFKVPVIIFVSFFIFNILAFFLIYFKMLGFSYVVMQTAVENNYLPPSELLSLAKYAYSMDESNNFSQANTSIITYFGDINDGTYDHRVVLNASGTGVVDSLGDAGTAALFGDVNGDASKKKQYGKVSKIGVYTDYTVVWPLDYRDTTTTGKIAGYAADGSGNSDTTQFKSATDLENMRNREFHQGDNNPSHTVGGKVVIPIRIVYTVPGLKYYPDLINY